MPIVRIDIWEGRTKEEKANLVRKLTSAVVDALHVPQEHVQVVIYETPQQNWGINGEPAEEVMKRRAQTREKQEKEMK